MNSVDLNNKWSIAVDDDEYECDLPYDVTVNAPRDYACAFGELNGYHTAARAVFTRALPTVKSGEAVLTLSGVCGYGDVFVNDERIAFIGGYSPMRLDLTGKLTGLHNTLRLDLCSTPGMSDKYVGLGIAGGVKLDVCDDIDFESGSLFVTSSSVGDKNYADATVTVKNNGEAKKLILECTAFNARGKRAGKKQRKIFLRANSVKSFTVRVRIAKAYDWTSTDPYMYTMTASLNGLDEVKTDSVRFGIVRRALNSIRGVSLNEKLVSFRGAYVSHADCAVGGVSNYSNEKRRFAALKDIGYNAVHFVECPAQATLDALDDIGMYAYVDLFGVLSCGKAPLDGHIFFNGSDADLVQTVKNAVIALRNHPSVCLYGVADDVPECYGRNDGHRMIKTIADAVREFDGTRPVTVSAREFVPSQRELENVGIKRHFDSDSAKINAGREKDLFMSLTSGAFDSVDICGYNYLHPLYSSEKSRGGRLVLGSRTANDKAFDCIEETEKNVCVVGDFSDCGIDYPGGASLNEISYSGGDLDALCDIKPQGVYKSILLGARNVAYITVIDPDTAEPTPVWNWSRFLGQTVTVQVYTSGDVVALYLDGRLLGRKLAGKVNRHIATFSVDYYPGELQAISYFKGMECARASLKTASSPKTVRLTTADKNLYLSRGDLGFVHIDVCDRAGNLVQNAMRTLNATVDGGELVAFINADPMLRKPGLDTCPAYGGKALCVIKPDPSEDKAVVKISGDGLLAAKITFKIKD